MNASPRLTTALLLAIALVSLAPGNTALAQTGPALAQYVGESPETFTENAGPGTDAVNDAMAGTGSSASSSASDEASDEASAPPENNGASDTEADEGLDSITQLPETGGAPLAALACGILLAAFGLIAYRAATR